MASTNDFVTRIATRLDTTGFDQGMRALINSNHQVQVSLDMNTINRQITDLENRLRNLSNTYNNIGGGNNGGNGSGGSGRRNSGVNDEIRAYQQLLSLAQRIGSIRTQIARIDNGQNANQIATLTRQLGQYQQEYANTLRNVSSLTQEHQNRILRVFRTSGEQVDVITAKLADGQQRLVSATKVGSLDNRMTNWLERNKEASGAFGVAIENLQRQLRDLFAQGGISQADYDRINNAFSRLDMEARAAGKTVSAFQSTMDRLGDTLKRYMSFAAVVNMFKQMAKEVLAVDTAMTGLYRVTDLSASQYKQMYAEMTASAKEYGATLSDIIDATTGWVKLGFDPKTSQRLAEVTTMYQHVTDLDTSTAVNNLVTAYKGFQEELLNVTNGDAAKAAEIIADTFDLLGNKFAVSAADVGEGLTNSASALNVAGNSLQQSAAMIVGITEVTQNASKAGNAVRTLAMRLRGTTIKELEDLGEDTDGLIEAVPKLRQTILDLTGNRVDIANTNGELRSTFEIMRDIASVWDTIGTNEQASLLENIAGKNRSSDIAALIRNFDQVEAALEAANNAAGTAAAENARYMESLQGKLDSFKASWQALANDVLDSDLLKSGVDFGARILDTIDALINRVGVLIPLATALTAALSFKSKTGELIISSDADYTVYGLRRKAPNGNMNDAA